MKNLELTEVVLLLIRSGSSCLSGHVMLLYVGTPLPDLSLPHPNSGNYPWHFVSRVGESGSSNLMSLDMLNCDNAPQR